MSAIKVTVLTRKDWQTYQAVRLMSLQDSPDSFGSTFEQESNLTSAQWANRLGSSDHNKYLLPLIAEIDGVPLGLAFGVHRHCDDATAHVYQMWVSPKARGQGVAKRLLEYIITWARTNKLNTILLDVTTSNLIAVNLYQAVGFEFCGQIAPLRAKSKLSTQGMALTL
ncbi:MAG: GNAT family N-acetyltransferase [Gammaproteobacteria bacterium]|nr:GNAT family N-acetyltransferase [Gammaproteobacteria bacterium]